MSRLTPSPPIGYLRRHYCSRCGHHLDAAGADGTCAALRPDLTRCGCAGPESQPNNLHQQHKREPR
jgi:hypothetical protein